MDMLSNVLSFIENPETRAYHLLFQFVIVGLLLLSAFVKGVISKNKVLISVCVLLFGIEISSGYFSWWNHVGRVDFSHHLITPFIATNLIILGAVLTIWSAWHGDGRR